MSIHYLKINADLSIAYHQLSGRQPGVIYCNGFMSDMSGTKATYIEQRCREQGRAFVHFDYRGHGLSNSNLQDGNISLWLADALAVLDQLTTGEHIIIGSSMGAWIALLVARARPERIQKIITIAAAPDFTENLIWAQLSIEQQQQLLNNETLYFPSHYGVEPYAITRQFIEDGRKNLLLNAPIDIHCPVHLFHGMQDADVPWQTSLRLAENLQTSDVKITLIKDGDHRLAREADIALLAHLVFMHNE